MVGCDRGWRQDLPGRESGEETEHTFVFSSERLSIFVVIYEWMTRRLELRARAGLGAKEGRRMDGCAGCLAGEETRSARAAILGLLLNFDAGSIWAIEEIVRQLSAPALDVIDGLADLQAAGLIHRLGDFVFVTRAASSFDSLDL